MSKMLEVTESAKNGGLTVGEGEEILRRLAEGKDSSGKKTDSPFAGALMAGSQESLSSILRAKGGSEKNPNAVLEKFAQQQIDLLGKNNTLLEAQNRDEPDVIDF